MNEHLKDILSSKKEPVDEQSLLSYLKGELSPQKAQEIEEQLAANEFEQEALEGLESLHDKTKLNTIRTSLHRNLQKKIRQNRKKRFALIPAQESLIYAVILIILLLMILAYWVISRSMLPR